MAAQQQQVVVDMPAAEYRSETGCWLVALQGGVINEGVGIVLGQVMFDIGGSLLTTDAIPVAQVVGYQTAFPEGYQLQCFQTLGDFQSDIGHYGRPLGLVESIAPLLSV